MIPFSDGMVRISEMYDFINKFKMEMAEEYVRCMLNDPLQEHLPFEEFLGYLPRFPLDFSFWKDVAIDGHIDIEKSKKFIKKIQLIHQRIQYQLNKS